MFGESISMGESLVVTVVSMVVVFLVLILISALISLLKNMDQKKTKEVQVEKVDTLVKEEPKTEVVQEENSDELIAVIAAAVAANLGLNIPDINIQSIRRIPQSTTAWKEVGKQEQLFGKL